MEIKLGNQQSFETLHICFGEDDCYFSKFESKYNLDKNVKLFIENHYEYIVNLWNRFVRFRCRNEKTNFYYSSPFISGLGYPPNYIISLGIILYIKKHSDKKIILLTKKKELISYFIKKRYFMPNIIEVKNALKNIVVTVTFLLKYFLAFFILKKIDSNKHCLVIHSYHDNSFFNSTQYITSKIPDFSKIAREYNTKLYYDINPSFFPIEMIFRFKKYGCVFSPTNLNLVSFFYCYIEAMVHLLKNKILFKSFYFSAENIFNQIFFNLIKVKSISRLINNISDKSLYIMPWENRGYQLGIEKNLNVPKKLLNYSCGLLSKISPEYVNYRYIKHQNFSHHITMSKNVKSFLEKVSPRRKFGIAKSPRIFNVTINSLAKKQRKKILVICPIDLESTKRLVKIVLGQDDYDCKIKLHPYVKLEDIPSKYVEKRRLSECLSDYSIAIYSGFTTASMEAYLSGLNVYKFFNPNKLSFDTMDEVNIKEIKDLKEISYWRKIDKLDELMNQYLGVQELDFENYIKQLI